MATYACVELIVDKFMNNYVDNLVKPEFEVKKSQI